MNHTLWQKLERVLLLIGLIVLLLDLFYWRP
jgi:hypothetical protein